MGEERAKAAAAEQKRVMQEMLAQQEAHQEMLHKVQADFTAQQQKLLEVRPGIVYFLPSFRV